MGNSSCCAKERGASPIKTLSVRIEEPPPEPERIGAEPEPAAAELKPAFATWEPAVALPEPAVEENRPSVQPPKQIPDIDSKPGTKEIEVDDTVKIEAAPSWCALRKVNYRVGIDLKNLTKVQLAVEQFDFVKAEIFVEEESTGSKLEWLKNPQTGYLLPLRHPNTGESLFLLMEALEGESETTAPDQIVRGYYPPEGLPIFPGGAPPGGKWREAKYCGPATIFMAIYPCCWPCLLALGQGEPIDLKQVYDAPDGLTYNEVGVCSGVTRTDAK